MLRSAKGVGPYLEFLRTPEAKTVKTRVHIDLAATSAVHHADPVAGLQDLGATPADVGQGDVPSAATSSTMVMHRTFALGSSRSQSVFQGCVPGDDPAG
jgi:hypothetical protein